MVGKPNFSAAAGTDGRVRVRHREFVMDVAGSADYHARALSINPSQPAAFPWLAALAQSYETYVFHSLRFEYMPSVGTSVNGVVLLAMDYDAADPAPPSKTDFMQTHGAVRGSPWDYTVLSCDKPDLNKLPQHFTRKSVWAGVGDIKTYDVGNLFIATLGQTSTANIGELYVTYDVELRTPQPVIPAPELYSANLYGGGTKTQTKPFGDVPTGIVANPSMSYNGITGAIDILRAGKYLLESAYNVSTNGSQSIVTDWQPAVAANGTLTLDARGYGTTDVLTESTLLEVDALPYSVVPKLVGAALNVISSKFRLAPCSF